MFVFILALAFCVALVFFNRFWPFTRVAVIGDLSEAGDSTVTIRGFHRTYLPSPGCVLEGVIFRHAPESKSPLISIDRLVIRGSYMGILRHHVDRVLAEGMRITIPPFGSGQTFRIHPSNVVIDEFVTKDARLDFTSADTGKSALTFNIQEATLKSVGWSGPLHYNVRVHNPLPPGEIAASGDFGLWRTDDAGQTPISGQYTFDRADLGVYGGIDGTLSSRGKFGGTLGHIDMSGDTDVPDFGVRSNEHTIHLTTKFTAYVDATKGDTFLKRVEARFLRTRVIAQGSVAGSEKESGKKATIELVSTHGRIEDLLGLFMRGGHAPMSGEVSMRAKAEIPSGDAPFLKKIKLSGAFGVDEGSFTSADTQQNVDKLSAGARGENKDDPQTVLTDLKGDVLLSGGVANFSDLHFGIPGAGAHVHGTYNILNHKIDLHGNMRVDSNISNTTTGVKSALLKVMDPFFKKKRKGEVVPVHIGGTYEHPGFGLDLASKAR
jgi:AsmA-like C-terminal region